MFSCSKYYNYKVCHQYRSDHTGDFVVAVFAEWQKHVKMRMPLFTLQLPVWFSFCRTLWSFRGFDLDRTSVPHSGSNSPAPEIDGGQCCRSSRGKGSMTVFLRASSMSNSLFHDKMTFQQCAASLLQEQLIIVLPLNSRDTSPWSWFALYAVYS